MADWDADVHVDEQLALHLVRTQFPEFQGTRARKLGAGWDNVAFLIDGRAVFRFPRRAFAVPFLERESVWLPRLAERLAMPIPAPRWFGEPTAEFERPFVGYDFIPGVTMCSAAIAREDRVGIAATVGAFCRELHSLSLDEFGPPPADDLNRRDLDQRLAYTESRVAALRMRGLLHDGAALELAREVRGRAVDDGVGVWTHGDLYARHVLVQDGAVTGIVDWGDVHFGDRALDLSIAWTAFDFDGRFEFFAAYGDVPDSIRYRAILRAIHYALTLIDYGSDVGDMPLLAEGEGALAEILGSLI